MTIESTLSRRLRAWRHRAKLSRMAAADVLGIPYRTIQNIEQGRGFPYPVLLLHFLETKELTK